MSTRSARSSRRSVRRPVTRPRTRPGTPWSARCAPRPRLDGAPVAGCTPLRDRVREPRGRTHAVRAGNRRHRHGARSDDAAVASETSSGAASAHARAASTASSPVGGIATATPSGVRASTTPSNVDGVDGCRAERLGQRLVVGHEHRPELDRAVEAVDVDRPHAPADPVAGLDDDDLEPGVHEVHGGGQPGDAGADHGDPLARLGTGDLLGGREPGVPRTRERAGRIGGQASPAIQRRSPTGSASDSRSSAWCRRRRTRRHRARTDRSPSSSGAWPSAAARRRSGRGGRRGRRGGRRGRLGVGDGWASGHVQLDSVTAAIPESDAARKVRRAMPPDAARESMGLRLSDRPPERSARRRRGGAAHGMQRRSAAGPPRSSPSWRSARWEELGVSNIRPGRTRTPSRSSGELDVVGERRFGEEVERCPGLIDPVADLAQRTITRACAGRAGCRMRVSRAPGSATASTRWGSRPHLHALDRLLHASRPGMVGHCEVPVRSPGDASVLP